ncbi:MAG TPA: glycosyltransferase [Nitrospirales bacterium]|jgi:glycosyltransferase involved in cell wall biosynthesis
MPVISIITPCFNEEASIAKFYQSIRQIFDEKLPHYQREHIFCDNASTDRTVTLLKEIARTDPSVKIIVNSRNFGILRNTFNGVCSASGDAVLLFMPVDMQDPPELIPDFVRLWESGYEIVFGIRDKREEPFMMRTLRRLYYRIISSFSYVSYPPNVGDFQLIDRKVHQALLRTHESDPFLRMMTFEVGFRSVGVPYTWRARAEGRSRNNLAQLIDQSFIGLISFSNIPLRLALFSGFAISVFSIIYGLAVIALTLMGYVVAGRGIPTIIVALFFFSGVQLFFIGVLGEYLLAVFNLARNRPIVTERERVNFVDK